MKSLYNIIFFILASMMFFACEDYVDIKTQGQLVPDKFENYRYLLNNSSVYEQGPRMTDVASDDVSLVDGSSQQSSLGNSNYYLWFAKCYTWQSPVFPLELTYYNTDYDWKAMYTTIAYCNTIISEVPDCNDATEEEKNGLIAEALVHRANAYLMLVNSYAKPYNASTASSDLGLPLLLKQTITQPLNRASVQTIYDQIIADLKRSIPSLPEEQLYNTLPSKPSAYGTLARCYLCMNDYENAAKYADSALLTRNTLNDLGNMTSMGDYPYRNIDPEILLSKIPNGGVAYTPTVFRLSDDLLSLLGTDDKRYSLFTAEPSEFYYYDIDGRFFYKDMALYEGRNIGPSVPEMMLIKAEYYARDNDPVNAMLWVNKIREKRFAVADYVESTATSADDALVKVIEERRREFFCRMLRWWDMRRLKDDPLFSKTYTRTFGGTTYTLEPSSNRYVFPIAESLIELNPELEPNP